MKSKVINTLARFFLDMLGAIISTLLAVCLMIAYVFYRGAAAWGVALVAVIICGGIYWVLEKYRERFDKPPKS